MCDSIGKYKCGKCDACYSIKRNNLAIRLKEHFKFFETLDVSARACLFGMLTYTNYTLPRYYPNDDDPLPWQKGFQNYIKRLRKLYPFLKFDYFVSAEFSPRGRFHLHPLFFVYLSDDFYTFKTNDLALLSRYHNCLRVLSISTYYHVKNLRNSHVKSVRPYTSFEAYVRSILMSAWTLAPVPRANWNFGISDFEVVDSAKAVIYSTKYMTKTPRDDRFRKTLTLIPKSNVNYKYIHYKVDKHTNVIKRDITKSYLISRGLGNYFFDSDQYRTLKNNFALFYKDFKLPVTYNFKVIGYKTYKVLVTPDLYYYDTDDVGFSNNAKYSLPNIWRQHLYDELAPLGSEYRSLISTAGINKLDFTYLQSLISLCQSYNIPFDVRSVSFELKSVRPNYFFDYSYYITDDIINTSPLSHRLISLDVPKIVLMPSDYQKLVNIVKSKYNHVSKFKKLMLWQNPVNQSHGGLV